MGLLALFQSQRMILLTRGTLHDSPVNVKDAMHISTNTTQRVFLPESPANSS
jgi:hypothetical protein